MGSYKVTQAFDVRVPPKREGWKAVVSIAAAILLTPVVGLVLLVLAGALLPAVPMLAMLFAGSSLLGVHPAPPPARVGPPFVLRPPVSHPSTP
jgi:hypothetical protein